MTNLTLSRRYAKALLAIGEEDGNYQKYGGEVADFAATLAQNDMLMEALADPVWPKEARLGVLREVLTKADYSQTVKNFLLLLQEKGRIQFLSEISQVYNQLVDVLAGLMRATVTSATAVSSEVEGRVQATLEKLTGKKIVLEVKEDPELIGGLVARVGDLVLDGSVRTQLESLKDSLKGVG